MDEAGARDFARMAAINNDKTLEHKFMTEPGRRWEPQPSNGLPQVFALDQMTFSQIGAAVPRLANSTFVRSRKVGDF